MAPFDCGTHLRRQSTPNYSSALVSHSATHSMYESPRLSQTQERGHAPHELEGPYVRVNPIGQLMRPGRLSVHVAGGAQHGHEDLGTADLARSTAWLEWPRPLHSGSRADRGSVTVVAELQELATPSRASA
jgi:hypothetical protein